jgi:Tol biopolymer transport system component
VDAPPPFEAAPEVLARAEHLRRRIAEKPEAKALHLQLSQLYIDAGRKDLALAVLEQLLAADPQNPYVRHRLDQLQRLGTGAVSTSAAKAAASRPRPKPPRPKGPLAPLRELISRHPRSAALAGLAFVLTLIGLRLLFPSTRLIATGGFRAVGAEWSPTGARFAFRIEGNDGVKLAVYDLREGSHRIVGEVDGWDSSAYAWSPDGARIAYQGPPDEQDWEPAIWVADAASGETRRVGSGSSPAWYLDGTSVLVACTEVSFSMPNSLSDWTEPTQTYCLLDSATGESRRIAEVASWEVSYSPVANKLAYTRMELAEGLDFDFAGYQDFEQFVDRVLSNDPSNFLEGSRDLARELETRRYMESRDADGAAEPFPYRSDVYVADLPGARQSRITTDGSSSFISWTPDGRRILYATGSAPGAEVRTMNPDGSDSRVVIPASLGVTDPSSVTLTANGRYALFVAPVEADAAIAKIMTGESPADLHILLVGSSSADRLGNKHPFKQRYALSPDGETIVYEVLTDVAFLERSASSELWLMSR